MAKFSYIAERGDGEVYHGSAEASDRFALYEVIRREGGRIVSFEQRDERTFWKTLTRTNISSLTRIKEYDKVLLARNLGAMLTAGLSLGRALSVMERQIKNAKLAGIIADISSTVRHGGTLHEAFAVHGSVFPKIFVAMVKAGEESGDLSGSLTAIADQMERMYTLKKNVRGALIYPSIILVAIIGIGFLMMTNVVPTLAQTFAEAHASLPPTTQAVIAVSNFMTGHTLLALFLIVAVVVGAYVGLKQPLIHHGFEWIVLRIPVIGEIVKEVNAARTSRTLAGLLASGVDVISALEITGEVVQNGFFQAVIREAGNGISDGRPLSSAFISHESLYPAFVGEMMAVGEETGATTDMLKRLAEFYESEVERKTKNMSTVIEPFLMLFIGAGVGFFAVSMIAPIYSLSQNVG